MDLALSSELPQFMRLIVALIIVLALMGGLSLVLKKLGLSTQANIRSGDTKRLHIVESLPLDARRRLVIIRRDDTEYLVILGPNSEIVVESGIRVVDASEETQNKT